MKILKICSVLFLVAWMAAATYIGYVLVTRVSIHEAHISAVEGLLCKMVPQACGQPVTQNGSTTPQI